MKLLVFLKYGEHAASSRYRFFQYLPYIEKAGIDYDINVLLNDRYVDNLNSHNQKVSLLLQVILSYFKRLKYLFNVDKYDMVIIQYELFPFLPSWAESFIAFRKPYIVDYDDAIFHNYDKNKNIIVRLLLKNKIQKVLRNASAAIVGSHYLYDYASIFNKTVFLLPTVVNVQHYKEVPSPATKMFTVGWIGSSSTSKYLLPYIDMFRKLSNEGVKFSFIGFNEDYKNSFNGVDVDWITWSRETEIEALKSFTIGIMPLNDTLWEKGKCGFKLIQYMACGIPVIASPVGENSFIVKHEENGFLANDEKDWYNYIMLLKGNKYKIDELGRYGLETAERDFSLEVTSSKFIDILISKISKDVRSSRRY